MQNTVVYTGLDNELFLCTPEQKETLDTLKQLNRGGIGTIYGYVPSSGYDISPELDLQIITRISVSSLYKRKIAALEKITFDDVADVIDDTPKLAELSHATLLDLFTLRKNNLIESMEKTLSGDRSDAARQGHDRNYITVCAGVKVNLVGEKKNGIKTPTMFYEPITKRNLPKADTIMLTFLELSRHVVKEGVYKKVNSGAPVLMTEAIESKLNKKSVGLKTLSLDPSKFKRLVVSKQEILKEDLVSATKDLTMAELILQLLNEYAS